MPAETNTYEFWVEQIDFPIIKRCDEMWVLMMPDWDKSKGVAAEIAFCKENNIPVYYVEPHGYGLYDEGVLTYGEAK